MIVYKATNNVDGKYYIGKTIYTLQDRINRHVYSAFVRKQKTYFFNSLRKYGLDNFNWDVLFTCKNEKMLLNKEKEYIVKYRANNPKFGYNMTVGGESGTLCKEAREKISKAEKGCNHHYYGKHFTEEHRKKIGESGRGKKRSKETVEKLRAVNLGKNNPNYGKKASKETRLKMSLSRSGEKNPNYGKKFSKEIRHKMSLAKKGKTLEEIYGKCKAALLRESRRKRLLGKNNHKYVQLFKEKIDLIIKLYEKGFSLCRVADKTSVGIAVIRRILKENGIRIRGRYERKLIQKV